VSAVPLRRLMLPSFLVHSTHDAYRSVQEDGEDADDDDDGDDAGVGVVGDMVGTTKLCGGWACACASQQLVL
jgi:hypothetical protein